MRDETDSIIKKVSRSASSSNSGPNLSKRFGKGRSGSYFSEYSPEYSGSSSGSSSPEISTLMPTKKLPPLDYATRVKLCFLTQYSFASSSASPFYYIQRFYPHVPEDGHLTAAVVATGFAFYSNLWSDREICQTARRSYDEALKLARAALGSQDIVKRDTTLIAVLLLNTFERLFSRNTAHEAQREASHLKGAIALVDHRGEEQFQEGVGMNIFRQLNDYIVLDCLRRTSAVPPKWLTIRKLAEKYIDSNDLGWRFAQAMYEMTALNACLKGKKSTVEQLKRAIRLDEEFVDIGQVLANRKSQMETKFSIVPKAMSRLLDAHAAFNAWKNIRIMRILVHELILDLSLGGHEFPGFDINGQIRDSTKTIQNLSAEIWDYLPQYVQCISTTLTGDGRSQAFSAIGFSIQVPDILFPLYVVHRSSVTADSMRQSILKQLQTWCQKSGTYPAHAMLKAVESHSKNVWEVWWNIGGEAFII